MIKIEVVLDQNGILRACKARGHAKAGKAGTDIVCAAVTVLMRTALSTLSDREGITIRTIREDDAPEPGLIWLEADYTAEGKDFLFAAGAFLTQGLRSVAEEFPECCSFKLFQN